MILTKPSIEIVTDLDVDKIYKRIEAAGRTCYKSGDKITSVSSEEFIGMIIKRGHESVLEHESISVRVICDRGVSHEIVRHRIASYSQESTRYCKYLGDVEFIIPPWVIGIEECRINLAEDAGEYTLAALALSPPDRIWLIAMSQAERDYNRLLHKCWKPEQARSVLPNSLKTEIVMTMNLREWRHFFKLRCAKAAHPQMREVADMIYTRLNRDMSEVFSDCK